MSNEHDTDPTLPHDIFQIAMGEHPKAWMVLGQSYARDMWIARIVANITQPDNIIAWGHDYGTGEPILASPVEIDVAASDADKTVAVLKAIEKAKAAIAKLQAGSKLK